MFIRASRFQGGQFLMLAGLLAVALFATTILAGSIPFTTQFSFDTAICTGTQCPGGQLCAQMCDTSMRSCPCDPELVCVDTCQTIPFCL